MHWQTSVATLRKIPTNLWEKWPFLETHGRRHVDDLFDFSSWNIAAHMWRVHAGIEWARYVNLCMKWMQSYRHRIYCCAPWSERQHSACECQQLSARQRLTRAPQLRAPWMRWSKGNARARRGSLGENIVSPVVGCGRLPEDMTKFSDIWKQVIHYTSSNKLKFQFYEVESVCVTTYS